MQRRHQAQTREGDRCGGKHRIAPGTPRPVRISVLMAGLLARGSQLCLAFPIFTSGIYQASLTAYSCGGSHGLGPFWVRLTVFPFHLRRCLAGETIGDDH